MNIWTYLTSVLMWKRVGRRTRRTLPFMLILRIRASSITLFVEKLQPDHQQLLLAHFLQKKKIIYIYV